MNTYIFILCPPYSGSTVLWQLLATSPLASALPCEGQVLAEVKDIMRHQPWNAATQMPWATIKAVWERYWDLSKPLLLEKSPPHLIRAQEIAAHFNPAYFLIMVRNPYAHCEGLLRRKKGTATEAAEFTVRCLRLQAENATRLKHTLCFSYEQLTDQTQHIAEQITAFIPQLGPLQHTRQVKVHSMDGDVERGIINLNAPKLSQLSAAEFDEINQVLCRHADVMAYWGYQFLDVGEMPSSVRSNSYSQLA